MPPHQVPAAAAAVQAAPSWYLARGDKQYGPIGNRELLLLAERGELKQDAFLWTPRRALSLRAARAPSWPRPGKARSDPPPPLPHLARKPLAPLSPPRRQAKSRRRPSA